MSQRNRRQVLRAGGATLAAALAGCQDDSSNSTDEPSDDNGAGTTNGTPTGTKDGSSGQNDAELEPVTVDEEWRMFQNGPRHTGYTDNTMPSGEVEQRWQFTIEDTSGAPSQPIIADGTLYLVDGNGDFRALDASDGSEQWQVDIDGPSVTPAYADGTVYVNGQYAQLEAYDANSGERLWRSDEASGNTPPVVVDDSIYGTSDGSFFAADASTGEQRWQKELNTTGLSGGAVAVSDGRVIGSVNAGQNPVVVAFDASSGEILWQNSYTDGLDIGATTADGTVLLPHEDGTLYALDPETGDQLWTYQPGSDLTAEVNYHDNTVYVHAAESLSAVDATTGEQQWQVRTEFTTGILGPDGVLSLPSPSLVYHDRASGQREWESELEAFPTTTPVVANGLVFIGSETGLTAYQAV